LHEESSLASSNQATPVINKETEVIGIADHFASEFPSLVRYAWERRAHLP